MNNDLLALDPLKEVYSHGEPTRGLEFLWKNAPSKKYEKEGVAERVEGVRDPPPIPSSFFLLLFNDYEGSTFVVFYDFSHSLFY